MLRAILSLTLMFFYLIPLLAQDDEGTANKKGDNVEAEIWSLEKEYIANFGDANHNAILSFYHSQFLGWPDSELHPTDMEGAKKYLEEKFSEPSQIVSQINQEGIRILGNIAITHYALTFSWIDDEGIEQTRESRLTHTWVKEDSSWKILGGMSNRIEKMD